MSYNIHKIMFQKFDKSIKLSFIGDRGSENLLTPELY